MLFGILEIAIATAMLFSILVIAIGDEVGFAVHEVHFMGHSPASDAEPSIV